MNEKVVREKNRQVDGVVRLMEKYNTFLIFKYSSLSAVEIVSIRKQLRAVNAIMCVLKNNILLRAFHANSITDYDSFLLDQNAIVFGNDSALIKIVDTALRGKELAKLKAGCLNGSFADEQTVIRVASLGSKNDLIVEFLAVIQAPIRKFLSVLNAVKLNVKK